MVALRSLVATANPRSVAVVERMQRVLLHLRHPGLAEYLAVAVTEETPLIKFLVLEEMPGVHITLRQLQEKVDRNKLLMKYFSERSYMMQVIIQSLEAIAFLDSKGVAHGDISSQNIVVRLDSAEDFRVQLVDSLHIKELVEIAMLEVSALMTYVPHSKGSLTPRS